MLRKLFFPLFLTAFFQQSILAQVGLGSNNPDATALLDLIENSDSQNKGLLIPRMTSTQRQAIGVTAAANSLLVFDTNLGKVCYFYNSSWYILNVTDKVMGSNPSINKNVSVNNVIVGNVLNPLISPGIIIMWSGPINTIPEGWVLCDGNNGTPNLVNKLVRGAADLNSDNVSDSDSLLVLTELNMPFHLHASGNLKASGGAHSSHTYSSVWISSGSPNNMISGGGTTVRPEATVTITGSGSHTHSSSDFAGATGSKGISKPIKVTPPFYAVAFIMKKD